MTQADLLNLQLRQGEARQAFLDALDSLATQGRSVSHSPRAANYAPRIIASLCDFSKRELVIAMEQLFAEHRIEANARVGQTKRRQPVYGITRQCF
jgi:hypothetical protein